MKKLIIPIVFVLFLWSCDYVEAPYAENYVAPLNGDTVKKVLLEEFTGHRCVNCPTASLEAHNILDFYGKQVVLVAIHSSGGGSASSGLAEPWAPPLDYDFTNDNADELYNKFSIPYLPQGLVNRQYNGTSYNMGKDAWSPAISSILVDEPDAFIEITPNFNDNDSTLDIEIRSTFLNDLSGDYKLSIYLIESGIISAQKNNNAEIGIDVILDYEHNHVLRAVVNSTMGEDLVSDPTAMLVVTKTITAYSIAGTDWNPDNMDVVAFIHRSDDADGNEFEVIQAEIEEMK